MCHCPSPYIYTFVCFFSLRARVQPWRRLPCGPSQALKQCSCTWGTFGPLSGELKLHTDVCKRREAAHMQTGNVLRVLQEARSSTHVDSTFPGDSRHSSGRREAATPGDSLTERREAATSKDKVSNKEKEKGKLKNAWIQNGIRQHKYMCASLHSCHTHTNVHDVRVISS